MIRLSERLANVIVNHNVDYATSTTKVIGQIDSQVRTIAWLYIKIHVKLYDTPRTEFLKQCNL